MSFFVYMLYCRDRSYYVGHTDDLERRVAQHQAGELPGYTKHRRRVELVWSQAFATRDEALSAERQIKGWSRAKKEALMRGDWASIQRLAWGTKHPFPAEGGKRASIPQPERSDQSAFADPQPTTVRPEVSKGPSNSTN